MTLHLLVEKFLPKKLRQKKQQTQFKTDFLAFFWMLEYAYRAF